MERDIRSGLSGRARVVSDDEFTYLLHNVNDGDAVYDQYGVEFDEFAGIVDVVDGVSVISERHWAEREAAAQAAQAVQAGPLIMSPTMNILRILGGESVQPYSS